MKLVNWNIPNNTEEDSLKSINLNDKKGWQRTQVTSAMQRELANTPF